MVETYDYNPKVKGSGLITCTTNRTECHRKCPDCFAKNGRAYTTLPNVPSREQSKGKVVRIGDIAEPWFDFATSLQAYRQYDNAFFNTSYRECVLQCTMYGVPVVLTANPGTIRGETFQRLPGGIPENLMYVRALIDIWNVELVDKIINYYAPLEDNGRRKVPVILTWFAFYETDIPEECKETAYTWRTRTKNPYWCISHRRRERIEHHWRGNPWVYTCGYKGGHACRNCGNCLREFHATKERLQSCEARRNSEEYSNT